MSVRASQAPQDVVDDMLRDIDGWIDGSAS
jgi:hypothetical protein